ncbi:hypothetical protein MMC25_007730 [Agyrium rufum]|nr:hypothetical protein [Agyrium rufum]
MGLGGILLRFGGTIIHGLSLIASILVLAIFSYFIAVLKDDSISISQTIEAVEGISAGGVAYGIAAILLTCCLGGFSFFAFIGIVVDLLFVGGFVAIAVLNRDGSKSCSGQVTTPIGTGVIGQSSDAYLDGVFTADLKRACVFQQATFALGLINAFLFTVSILLALALGKHHMKSKRQSNKGQDFNGGARDVEIGGVRPSQDSSMSGATVTGPDNFGNGQGFPKPNQLPIAASFQNHQNPSYGAPQNDGDNNPYAQGGNPWTVANPYAQQDQYNNAASGPNYRSAQFREV